MNTPSRMQSEPAKGRRPAKRAKAAKSARPAIPSGFGQLAAGAAVVRRAARWGNAMRRWGLRLVVAAIALYALWKLFLVVVGIATTDMWFDSVHASSVYHTMIWARVLLFVVFGLIAGAVGCASIMAIHRIRPKLALSADNDTFRWTLRKYEPRFRWFIVLLAVVIPAILVGQRAQSGWQTYLLWRHATPFHASDPLFHKDVSFFVEVYPFHAMVVSLLLQAVKYGLIIAVFAGYWYGAWRIRGGSRKVTRGMTQVVSLLVAAYLVFTAASVWISRYGLTTSARGPVTGAGPTDVNAALPAKYVLVVIALVLAALAVANAVRRCRVRWLAATLVLITVTTTLLSSTIPGLYFHFREAPSASKVDLGEISHNIAATRAAFGLDSDVKSVPYSTSNTTDPAQLLQLTNKTAQTSLIDPNQLSPTFNVEQQLQAYYGFKSTLDIGHYNVHGKSQDVALAARELQASGIPSSSWVNSHLVYTHGYGLVAAPTTEVDPKTQSPLFLNGGMPPSQDIPVTRPQIYFGQGFSSSAYSIVGQPKGEKRNLEFDHPGGNGSSASAHTTYRADGGIPIGSTLRRLLFAVQLNDPNIFFSSEVNSASQLLTVRNPRARVAMVAPWLTLDGDVYPAVVNGEIKWIVDGYTTSSNYPDSQLINLHNASATTLTARGASVAQPNTQINYFHNSVKAVVDAYTGKVTLYEWDQQQHADPLLKAWESVFPGLVKPQSNISSALMAQLRYPTDLFNVQRYLLAKYHVTNASDFYNGNNFWAVPSDPTVGAASNMNTKSGGSSGSSSSPPLPSIYMAKSPDGYSGQQYSLSSPMVTLNGRELASYVSVNAQPGPDYGKFTVLDFPASSGGEAPSQVQNDIESNTSITEALTLQRGGNSRVVLGGLEAIPVGGRILYVEPVYTQSNGGSSFPILRHVIALYANGDPSFETSLQPALRAAFESAVGGGSTPARTPPHNAPAGGPTNSPAPSPTSSSSHR